MGQRPADFRPPAYLSKSPPVPKSSETPPPKDDPLGQNPVRYGDWELKGIAVDF